MLVNRAAPDATIELGRAAGRAFLPLQFDSSANGTLYADDEPFSLLYTDATSAFTLRQLLVSVSAGHISLR